MMESLVLTLGNISATGIDVTMDGNGKVYFDLDVRPAVVTAAADSAAGTVTARPVVVSDTGTTWDGDAISLFYTWSDPDVGVAPATNIPEVGDVGIIVESKYFIPYSKGTNTDSSEVSSYKYTITTLTNGVIEIPTTECVPVVVYTASSSSYIIESGSLTKTETGWTIDPARYLVYDNVAEFTAPWTVYCAGGVKGEDGLSFSPDVRGLLTEKSQYDSEAKGFAFFALDERAFYFKLSSTVGDWSEPSYLAGATGVTGVTFIPSVSSDGVISWTNNGGLENPASVSIKGEPGEDGTDGINGKDGIDGKDGITPHIGDNGNWYLGSTDTGVKALGTDGVNGTDGQDGTDGITPHIGDNGNWYLGSTDTGKPSRGEDGTDGVNGSDGQDGITPHIGDNGNWYLGDNDTGVKALGTDGQDGADGIDGTNGTDGVTPHIGDNGNWYLGEEDTGVKALGTNGTDGTAGTDGITPHIADNGNWMLGDTDTGISARGGVLNNFKLEITEINSEGNIVISDSRCIPVAVHTSAGNVYIIEKGSMSVSTAGWAIDASYYLAYDNVAEFTGPWYVYCAGGSDGTVSQEFTTTGSMTHTMESGVYLHQARTASLTSLNLEINENSNNSCFCFNAGTGFTYTVSIAAGCDFYINNPFNFEAGSSYIVAVDNMTIMWGVIEANE